MRFGLIWLDWLACYTQEEIVEFLDCERATEDQVLRESADLPKREKPYADHLVVFQPPIYSGFSSQLYLLKIPVSPYAAYVSRGSQG